MRKKEGYKSVQVQIPEKVYKKAMEKFEPKAEKYSDVRKNLPQRLIKYALAHMVKDETNNLEEKQLYQQLQDKFVCGEVA